jgi:hypothetical protein
MEKEMQLRRKQKEEQATEVQVIIYDTEQQQEQKNEYTNGFRRGHNRHDTEHPAKAAPAKPRQRLAATDMANLRGRTGTGFEL